MFIRNKITIERPQAEVFAYLAQAEHFPRWNYAVESVTQRQGQTYEYVRHFWGKTETGSVDLTINPIQDTLTIRSRDSPHSFEVHYKLTIPTKNTTTISNEIRIEPKGVWRGVIYLLKGRIRQAVYQNLNVLKDLLEQNEN